MTSTNTQSPDFGIVTNDLFRSIYTGLLKRTVLLSRNRVFSQADVEEELARSLGHSRFYRRQVTEALGVMRALGIVEAISVLVGSKMEEKYRLREDSIGRKLALLNHRRRVVVEIIADEWRINPYKREPDFAPLKDALAKLKSHLDQASREDHAVNTLDFVHLHGIFWAALPLVVHLDYWHEVLVQLGSQITISRIAFPAPAQVVSDCEQIVMDLEAGRTKVARQKADQHLQQFENDLELLDKFLRDVEGWESGCHDTIEEARVAEATWHMHGMIRRIILERRADYPNVPRLDISDEKWEQTWRVLTRRAAPLFPSFAKKYRQDPASTGQPVTWLIHLVGQLLGDPVELLEISKAVCTKKEILVLEQMAAQMTFREIAEAMGVGKASVVATAQHAKRSVLKAMNSIDGMSSEVERIEALSDDITFQGFFTTWDKISSPACPEPSGCPTARGLCHPLRALWCEYQ